MKLKLIREDYTNVSSIGKLYIDGVLFCYVLEDKVREINEKKVYGKTAIPAGNYKVIMSFSNRFQVYMPELLDVKGFAGIRIHSGNTEIDSLGCLILGYKKGENAVYESKKATTSFYAKLKKVEKKEKITIEIVDTND